MNKTAIKNFAVWARNKLITDITYKAGLIGVSEKGIAQPLPQSSKDLQFFDIGTKDYAQVAGADMEQRKALVRAIQDKESTSDYKTAFKAVIEEVAYTWFNRLIAIRFMEVNDYLPSRIRVLSSENPAKNEPDFVTTPFDTDIEFTAAEQDKILQLKDENKLDELFRMLFIKQCNKLNEILPELFEKTNNYTEMLLSISFTDSDGVVYHLVHDIPEDNFNIKKEGQVEIIGWMYQYYNIEPKDETFALLKKNVKITKERIPAATQLFTPDWIVRYMVENSLGRLWVEGHPSDSLKENWKYYLEEAKQEASVQAQLEQIRAEYRNLNPEDIKVIDPCMGSGHILVYCFDVLMQIYESQGYTQRDAAQSILENNLFGLDIDKRAAQLSYFAVMMKARQYDRRIFTREIKPHVYAIEESNGINRGQLKYFGVDLSPVERNKAKLQISGLLDTMVDAKEYGSILNVENYDWELLQRFVDSIDDAGQMTLDSIGIDDTQNSLKSLIRIGQSMAQKYHIVVTNPPYMGNNGMDAKLVKFVKENYNDVKMDMFSCCLDKGLRMIYKYGYVSMITMESWMFLSSFEILRKNILKHHRLENLVHMPYLGKGGTSLGINFGTVAAVINGTNIANYRSDFQYVRYFETDDNGVPFNFPTVNERKSNARIDDFDQIPGMPVAYWVDDHVFEDFRVGTNITKYIDTFQGIITGDNNKFLRLWYEPDIHHVALDRESMDSIDLEEEYWIPYNKGGDFRNWYGNQEYVVFWKYGPDDKTRGKKSFENYYLRDYVSWSYITSSTLASRYFPKGFLWDVSGSGIFDKTGMLHYLQALIGSKVGIELLKIINPTINYQVENIAQLPVLIDQKERVDELVKANIEISRRDWDSFEHSWNFKKHPLIPTKIGVDTLISDIFHDWELMCTEQFEVLKSNEEEINRIFINTYQMSSMITPEVTIEDVTVRKADLSREIKSLLSYAVGCMFGRYSLDIPGLAYAGGQWEDYKYQSFIPNKDNCIPITDEEYFEDDIVGRLTNWLKVVYGSVTLEENLNFIAQSLGGKGTTSREVIRNYFLNDFYKDHCSVYSVTGSGKRPIYWLFDSGKQNGFKALVYMHRWNADTVGNLRVEYLHKMQHTYEREIVRMQETIDNSRDSREVSKATKRKDKLQKQLKETKDYDAKLAHIALSRIEIDLDDGVKVNYEKIQTGRDGKKMQILAKI